jgi:Myb-like DNA-binding domain
MSPEHSFETRDDYSKMATAGEATVSSSQSTDSTTQVQGESWELSPVAPPPSGAAQRTGRWTPDEKILFLYGLKRFGKGRWKKMSIYLPHRYVQLVRIRLIRDLQMLDRVHICQPSLPKIFTCWSSSSYSLS